MNKETFHQKLTNHGACQPALDWVKNSAQESAQVLYETCSNFNWIYWLTSELGFGDVAYGIWTKFNQQTAPLWAEYCQKTAPLWAEYDQKTAQFWAEYDRQEAKIQAEFCKILTKAVPWSEIETKL